MGGSVPNKVTSSASESLSSWVQQWQKRWGKDWKIILEEWNLAPFQWNLSTDTRPQGFRLRFSHLTQTTSDVRAYEKNEQPPAIPLRWTIYFYTNLKGGFRYPPFERKHPDRWWGYVDDLMVLLPSEALNEKNTQGTQQIEQDLLSFLKSKDKLGKKKRERIVGKKPWIALSEKEKEAYLKLTSQSKKKVFYFYQSTDLSSSLELDVQGPL